MSLSSLSQPPLPCIPLPLHNPPPFLFSAPNLFSPPCALGVAAVSGRPLDANLNAGLLAAFLLYVVLNVMTGVALGALVHNSAAAIVASFILPFGFGLLGRTSQFVARWLDYSTTFNWLLNGQWSGHTTQILVSVVLWVAIPLAAGLAWTVRREVTYYSHRYKVDTVVGTRDSGDRVPCPRLPLLDSRA